MSLFPKLETAIDHGVVLLGETTALVRLAQRVLTELQPTVAELPALVREARRAIDVVAKTAG